MGAVSRRAKSLVNSTSVNAICHYCPGGCRGMNPDISDPKGCHIVVYGYLGSIATNITDDGRTKIVESRLTIIINMV